MHIPSIENLIPMVVESTNRDREQYVQKFRTLAADVLEPAEIERFLDVAQRLPQLTPEELGQLTIIAAPGVLASVETPHGIF